ncbi:trypsin-like peptidase domain-containing protein [Roseiconus lacunae]|uniref:trypsin-like peptidase domain-containing protein n=1 Tax=Roseiconus lacunae TaxID=2605694 RepID=UPI0011F3AEEE|nr:trypsin-like peptidase domain-containing protein [Roseiconus lacunae]MCD0463125.1 trypsin-like peptidase domain-containing protein [Roseiconus lacunae]WRQ53397.1 trypsin-like peptidase domain-containing protein [Stieleria sp. HD01]
MVRPDVHGFARLTYRVDGVTMLDQTMFGRLSGAAVTLVVFLVSMVTGTETASAKPVLVAFGSEHCGHCKAMEPTLRQLEQQGTPIRYVDVNRESDFARRHGVRQVPTLVVLSGGRELTRLVGAQSMSKIREALEFDQRRLLPTETGVHHGQLIDSPDARFAQKSFVQNPPIGNSSVGEAMPSLQRAQAVERARAATVRLRVKDGHGFGVGTGTIIDRHGEEALVLTCGHLFRETQLQSNVEVDLFIGNQVRTVPGQVVDYDAEDRDIALVTIRPGCDVAVVPLIGGNEVPQIGQTAFSFGCDRGADPSRRDTRVTGVDKYNPQINASNLEIAGAPIDGRSGGGLFDDRGVLIGVCNAADYNDDVGIYTGPRNIAWQMSRIGMSHLCDGSSNANVAATAPARPSGPQTQLATIPHALPSASHAPSQNPVGQDMIVIIRDPNHPSGQRVLNVRQPTAELLSLIESSARR